MQSHILNLWLEIMSEGPNSLLTPVGNSVWIDGINLVTRLDVTDFCQQENVTEGEKVRAMNLLSITYKHLENTRDFSVSGHSLLFANSKIYQYISNLAANQDLQFNFTTDEFGHFSPWDNTVNLGTKFYSKLGGVIRIPFYSYNHENAHHALFKQVYSNINISDAELVELFVLAEWFCISLDLALAYDLKRSNLTFATAELSRVLAKANSNIFADHCGDIKSLNQFANHFRERFLDLEEDEAVYGFISKAVLSGHQKYSKEKLLVQARNVPGAMEAEDARQLLKLLRSESFSEIMSRLTGIKYED